MEQDELDRWFQRTQPIYEAAYLSHDEPWRQSGMSGPEERWISLRKPVADCIDHSGSFLDIGCANGYLLEWCLRWTAERGVIIEPYGLDVSAPLLDLARARLPQYANHFYLGNAYYWTPPLRFDFCRTELVYVPADYERPFLQHLLEDYLQPGGRLLIANYAERHPHPERGMTAENHPTTRILDRLADLGLPAADYRDGYDPIKDRHVRIAILTRPD